MAGNNANCKYIEMIREIRVTNIHASFGDSNVKAVDNFCEVLERMGYNGRDICLVRANTYQDSVGDVWWKIYTCCTKLENNDVLISRLRSHVLINNRTWDANASSKCQVLAFTSNTEREKRMIDEMVRIHRANATTINDELHKLDALEDQIQRAKLTLNLRLNLSTTKGNELDKTDLT